MSLAFTYTGVDLGVTEVCKIDSTWDKIDLELFELKLKHDLNFTWAYLLFITNCDLKFSNFR